jgi:hypothetical protein
MNPKSCPIENPRIICPSLNVCEKVVDYYRNNEIVKIVDVDDIPTNNNIFCLILLIL